MRLMVEQCWDRMHPVIEDGDVEVRAGPFNWIDDTDRGAWFPNTVKGTPLVKGPNGNYSYLDRKQAQDTNKTAVLEEIEKAITAAPTKQCKDTVEDITQALEDLNQLATLLGQKMGAAAPGLTGVRGAVGECLTLAHQILERKPPEAPPPEEKKPEESKPGEAKAPAAGAKEKTMATREDAYRQLQQAASLLRQIEPHSPIPYLVERWGASSASRSSPNRPRHLVRNDHNSPGNARQRRVAAA
jgi:type VI secretion system ImpA family protein